MKKLLFAAVALLAAFSGTRVSAQGNWGPDEANCLKYLSFYEVSFKSGDYASATPNWRKAYATCPHSSRQSLLTNGTTLLRKVIVANQNNPEYKQALIDSLLTLHDERAEFFPKSAVIARNNKGIDIVNYYKGNNEVIYKGLNEVIEANGESTKESLLVNNLNSAIELYKLGKLSSEDVILSYQRNVDYIDNAMAKAGDAAAKERIGKVKTDLESLFISSKVADCDNLIALFTPRYEANPNDSTLVTNIVKMMSITEDCQSNDLFLKAVTSLHRNSPSYVSAYNLYKLNAARGNVDLALGYIDEAVEFEESDASKDASYSFEAATLCFRNGRLSKAYSYANKALELDSSFAGKAYFLMGQIWGATTCGGDEIEKRAHFWVAVDFLNKAKNADESLAAEANKMIGSYSIYFPETTEAFMYNITDGQSYRVVCNGMQATTTVRTRK